MGFGITYSKPLSAINPKSSGQGISPKSEVRTAPAQKQKKLESPQEASNTKKAEIRERVEENKQRDLDRSRGQNIDFKA